jgi:hypothetical protein
VKKSSHIALILPVILLVILPSMRAFMPWLAYFSNRDYYSEICINQAKPELHCNGACHARMEIAATPDPDDTRIPRPPMVEVEEVLFIAADEVGSCAPLREVRPLYSLAVFRQMPDPFYEIPVPPPWAA